MKSSSSRKLQRRKKRKEKKFFLAKIWKRLLRRLSGMDHNTGSIKLKENKIG